MTRPLNILHLTTFYPPYSFGGDAMYIYRLSHALGNEGHQVDVIHEMDAFHLQHPGEPEIVFKEHPNVHRHGLKSKYGWFSPLVTHQTGRPYLQQKRIQEIMDSKPYDVFHYHNISLIGPETMTFTSNRSRPIKLYTTHEHWLICPTHVLWKFNHHACKKPECLKCTLLAKRPPQLWRYNGMLTRTSKYIDRFVAPSRFTAKIHAERGFSQPVHHLPYFIDRADDDWRNPRPRPQETPYFLFVGRLERIKGLHTLIRLWDQVPSADLLVAGTGRQADELLTMAAGNPRIKFLGPLPQKELGGLYYNALATIVPSITYETFGIIIVESFARKTPVIVRDLGALPEIVRDSGGGFIYRTDKECLDAIKQLISHPFLREDLGESGYASFVKYWSKEAHMKLYFGMISDLALQKYNHIPWKRI